MDYVTEEQIKRAKEVSVYDYLHKYEPNNVRRVGKEFRLKDHDSFSFTDDGKWYWHSHGVGGRTALKFLMEVRGYRFVDAVCALINERAAEHSDVLMKATPQQAIAQEARAPPQRLPIALPRRNKDNNRVIAYLQSRGIDKALILDCIKRGCLYESAIHHNCVFLGKDEKGKPRFAAMRSTTARFMCDAEGSDKRFGFLIPPESPHSTSVASFESPVDAISHQSLCKQGSIPPYDGWRISLGGTSALALEYFLKQHPEVSHCLICTDNDDAGNRIAAKIAETLGIVSERSLPAFGKKDWNDMLQAIKQAERTSRRPRHREEIYL